MPRLVPVPDLSVDDAPYEGYFDALTVLLNYLAIPGADLASATTINPTASFHKVTGTTTVTTITDSLGAVAGQPLTLFFTGALTLTHGTGNIRLVGGASRNLAANTLVSFIYDGTNWIEQNTFPRQEAGYAEYTSNQSITATAENAAQTVVQLSSFYTDGVTTFEFEFFCPKVLGNTDDSELHVVLFDGSDAVGELVDWKRGSTSGGMQGPVLARRRITPAAGSHVFSMRAYNSNATVTVQAGAGGPGNLVPGYMRAYRP